MEAKQETVRITRGDFFSGVFAVLALNGCKVFALGNKFDEAMAEVFQELAEKSEMLFRIQLHWFHGDSETVYRGLMYSAQVGVITFDSPGNVARIKLTEDMARAILKDISCGELFTKSADRITAIFRGDINKESQS